MPFDAERFERAKLEPRRASVPVDALAAWFDDGEPAVWEVRGLTASELHRAMEAGKRQDAVEVIVKAAMASTSNAERIDVVRKALGMTKDTPGEIAKRLEMLVTGSVAPVVELPTAVRLAEAFPVEFMVITNKITELTGQGFDVPKPAAASQTTTA